MVSKRHLACFIVHPEAFLPPPYHILIRALCIDLTPTGHQANVSVQPPLVVDHSPNEPFVQLQFICIFATQKEQVP